MKIDAMGWLLLYWIVYVLVSDLFGWLPHRDRAVRYVAMKVSDAQMSAIDSVVKWLLICWIAYVWLAAIFSLPPSRPAAFDGIPGCDHATLNDCLDADFRWMKTKGLL